MKVDLKYLGIGGAILTGLYFFANDLIENAAMRKKVNLSLSDLRNGVSDKITNTMIDMAVTDSVRKETERIMSTIHHEIVEQECRTVLMECASDAVSKCFPIIKERISGQVDEQIRKIDSDMLSDEISVMAIQKSSDRFDRILDDQVSRMNKRMEDMYKTLEKTAKSEIQNRIRNGLGIGNDILSIRLTK